MSFLALLRGREGKVEDRFVGILGKGWGMKEKLRVQSNTLYNCLYFHPDAQQKENLNIPPKRPYFLIPTAS